MKISAILPLTFAGLNLNGGTTGSNGGVVATVTNQANLENCRKASGKYVVEMPGRITNSPKGKEISVTNDKTIIGGGASGEFSGGGGTTGGIFENISDGGIDLRKDTNSLTIFNAHFEGVDKAMGIGWTDNAVSTVYKFQYAHFYNNYVRGENSHAHYARGSTNMRMDNVYIESTKETITRDDTVTLTPTVNTNQSCSGTIASNHGRAFNARDHYNNTLDATGQCSQYWEKQCWA